MGRPAEPIRPGPDLQPLLNASKYFLCHRNFAESLKYADKAQQSSPNHPGPPQILAISAVLSASPTTTRLESSPDWYSILNLPRFTDDPNLIRTRFNSLTNLLNPEKNPYPFAAEAQGWVLKAGSCLSNRNAKAQFDKELKMKQENTENGGGPFWTLCPYCYFMYEFEKTYEDCVLRCQNASCRRAFTAVAVGEAAAPPPEVVKKGEYVCYGFSPLGPENERGADSSEEKGKKWWAPFVSMGSKSNPGQVRVNGAKVEGRSNEGLKRERKFDFIDISDDEIEGEVKKRGDENGNEGGKVVMKRKKMAAKCTKKLMGKGIRVQEELKAEGKQDNANRSGEMESCIGDGL